MGFDHRPQLVKRIHPRSVVPDRFRLEEVLGMERTLIGYLFNRVTARA